AVLNDGRRRNLPATVYDCSADDGERSRSLIMRRSIAIFVLVAIVPTSSLIGAETRDELVAQVQAADLLSDLLTWTSDRAASRVAAMSAYLKEAGKLEEFKKQSP